MKTKIIFLACLIISSIAFGQNQKVEDLKNVLENSEVKVTNPTFTGIENILSFQENKELSTIADYLKKNMIYPENSKEYYEEGTEVVQFVVTPTGELTDFVVINSVSREIDEEIVRVLKTTEGMWIPGSNNADAVPMKKEVSLVFKGEDSRTNFLRAATNYYNKGSNKFLVKGKVKSALREYNKAMMLKPYDKSLLLMRGLCRYSAGDKEGAHQDWIRLKSLGGLDDIEDSYLAADVSKTEGYSELISLLEKE